MFAANNVLGLDHETVGAIIEKMVIEGELAEKTIDGVSCTFLKSMYFLELDSAVLLTKLVNSVELLSLFDVDSAIENLERSFGAQLADAQREAVKRSLSDGVLVVTGGPGTGKTTILRFIISIMESRGLELELSAPTGRAAKRITDATGSEARTLHRLLEYNASSEEFNRDEDYPIEADVVIIDEMSMVDISLFHALLKALAPGTRLIMVGDVDQLPSVGPGNVLRDVVSSGVAPVIRLNEIFRQAGRSSIVTNAHLVNRGSMPVLGREDEDFLFYNCPNAEIALNSVLNLCADYAYLGKANEIQVLSPMKGNTLGVLNLNSRLQDELNPARPDKPELQFGDIIFREGDRVMQIKNDYDMVWTKPEKDGEAEGMGVFNGDIGTIMELDNANKYLTVLFDDERSADYNFTQLEELELAYCISVHKSQGSEFPVVVLPLVSGPSMLFNRNILYTAITRAKSQVYVMGSEDCIRYMVNNTNIRKRYSALAAFLAERKEAFA